ncbi:hypothetical protein [Streptomyces sp. NPDC058371]|uniref:hypothetical protein n=1 Tax=Streptomyces sp. NPDC058371 TaxID=3346463 RepID=UPI00364C91EA
MNHVLCGLAANAALPSELVDRLIAVADDDVAEGVAGRADLSHAQAAAANPSLPLAVMTIWCPDPGPGDGNPQGANPVR